MSHDYRAECDPNGYWCLLIEISDTERCVIAPGKHRLFAMLESDILPLLGGPSICLLPIVISLVKTLVSQVVRVNRSLLDKRPDVGDQEVEKEEQDVHEQVFVGGS